MVNIIIASSAVYIAPGQGFFVASKTDGGTLKFLESMQTTTGEMILFPAILWKIIVENYSLA